MAYVTVPGSNSIWEYDNAPASGEYYEDANGTVSGGVRSFTPPGGNAQEIYVKCRKVGETTVRGELNKNYYDARV